MIEILESFGRYKRAMNGLIVKEMKPLGLGYKQASMLRYLSRNDLSSHADLARHTVTDPAATGKVVAGLIKRGLLRQQEHASDKRRWVLSLTAEGKALAKKVTARVEDIATLMAAPLSPKEQKALMEMLDKISDSLKQKGNLS